jgi:hypothetical protein
LEFEFEELERSSDVAPRGRQRFSRHAFMHSSADSLSVSPASPSGTPGSGGEEVKMDSSDST